jgi:HJR/Mrr/RecB family endonuclease
VREFGDEGTKNLLKDIERIKKQIRESKGILGLWKELGLSKEEIK